MLRESEAVRLVQGSATGKVRSKVLDKALAVAVDEVLAAAGQI